MAARWIRFHKITRMHIAQSMLIVGRALVLGWLTLHAAFAAESSSYPSKAIKLVVPYPAAGGADSLARPLAQQLSVRLAQSVVVDNRGGAGGNIAMELVTRSPADGHTLMLALTPQLAVNGALYPKLGYDPIHGFTPISLIAEAPYLLLVHPSLQANTVQELMALAAQDKGKLAYASSGSGSGGHMAAELLIHLSGVSMTHVPYKGGGPALSDVLAGHVKVIFAPAVSSMQYIQSGRLKPLAVSGKKRLASLPQVPTMAEAGIAGYDSTVWYALLAPANTPRDIVQRLYAELLQTLKDPSFKSMMAANGIEPLVTTPEELSSHITQEIVKWSKVVKSSGMRAD